MKGCPRWTGVVLVAAVVLLHGWAIDGLQRAADPAPGRAIPTSPSPPAPGLHPVVLLASAQRDGLVWPSELAQASPDSASPGDPPAAEAPAPSIATAVVRAPRPSVAPSPVGPARPRSTVAAAAHDAEAGPPQVAALPPTPSSPPLVEPIPEPQADAPPLPDAAPTTTPIPPPPPIATPTTPPDLLLAAAEPNAAVSQAPSAPPTYRTRIPAAAQLSYRLSRSGIVGRGEIDWRPAADGYELRLEGRIPILGTLITQTSQGRFDAAGLAPLRHTDRRIRRSEQAANFQRASGQISFSGGAPDVPLQPGVQDRLSVMLQLAAIANAWSRPPPSGQRYSIQVVGARGDMHRWSIRYEGAQPVQLDGGAVPALRFLREPEGPHDTRAEFWLDPARQCLPLRVLLTDDNGDALELLRAP